MTTDDRPTKLIRVDLTNDEFNALSCVVHEIAAAKRMGVPPRFDAHAPAYDVLAWRLRAALLESAGLVGDGPRGDPRAKAKPRDAVDDTVTIARASWDALRSIAQGTSAELSRLAFAVTQCEHHCVPHEECERLLFALGLGSVADVSRAMEFYTPNR